jgi:voltage-gated potassium channel
MSEALPPHEHRLRRWVYHLLDGAGHDGLSHFLHGLLVGLVGLSVAAVVLQSVPEYEEKYNDYFEIVEYVAVAVFTIEYLLRLWSAPEHTPYAGHSSLTARWSYVVSGWAIIDLVSILPFYLSFIITTDLRVLLFLRLLRFFKLARYSAGMRTMISVLEAEKRALLASSGILFGCVLFAATAMHLAEHDVQPEKFGSIPDAMWWAIVTITTLGYGDVTPVTLAGRLIASVTMVTGYVMLGLPVGIVASAFAEEIHRREFVVTWSMLSRVPLFHGLDANGIAEIMRYLRAQSFPAGTLIVRQGETAHSMYFIAEGEVEIALTGQEIHLGEGQFFGEMALLHNTLRSANVRAIKPTKLLVLDAYDLKTIMTRNPKIGRLIETVAAGRAEFSARERRGDIIAAELEPTPPEATPE